MRVRLAVRAVEDISAARDWYDEVDPGLGAEFLTELDRVLERLMMFPRSGAPVTESVAYDDPGSAASPTASAIG